MIAKIQTEVLLDWETIRRVIGAVKESNYYLIVFMPEEEKAKNGNGLTKILNGIKNGNAHKKNGESEVITKKPLICLNPRNISRLLESNDYNVIHNALNLIGVNAQELEINEQGYHDLRKERYVLEVPAIVYERIEKAIGTADPAAGIGEKILTLFEERPHGGSDTDASAMMAMRETFDLLTLKAIEMDETDQRNGKGRLADLKSMLSHINEKREKKEETKFTRACKLKFGDYKKLEDLTVEEFASFCNGNESNDFKHDINADSKKKVKEILLKNYQKELIDYIESRKKGRDENMERAAKIEDFAKILKDKLRRNAPYNEIQQLNSRQYAEELKEIYAKAVEWILRNFVCYEAGTKNLSELSTEEFEKLCKRAIMEEQDLDELQFYAKKLEEPPENFEEIKRNLEFAKILFEYAANPQFPVDLQGVMIGVVKENLEKMAEKYAKKKIMELTPEEFESICKESNVNKYSRELLESYTEEIRKYIMKRRTNKDVSVERAARVEDLSKVIDNHRISMIGKSEGCQNVICAYNRRDYPEILEKGYKGLLEIFGLPTEFGYHMGLGEKIIEAVYDSTVFDVPKNGSLNGTLKLVNPKEFNAKLERIFKENDSPGIDSIPKLIENLKRYPSDLKYGIGVKDMVGKLTEIQEEIPKYHNKK